MSLHINLDQEKYLIMVVFIILGFSIGDYINNFTYKKGLEKGYKSALDTVYKICRNHIESDTTVTRLVLIGTDTNVFIIYPQLAK